LRLARAQEVEFEQKVNAAVYAQAIVGSREVARAWRARTSADTPVKQRQTRSGQDEAIARLAAMFPDAVEVH